MSLDYLDNEINLACFKKLRNSLRHIEFGVRGTGSTHFINHNKKEIFRDEAEKTVFIKRPFW
jgi:hypothetical protein